MFFSWIISPQAYDNTKSADSIGLEICGDIHKSRGTTEVIIGVVDTGSKFSTGGIDTGLHIFPEIYSTLITCINEYGGKFATRINDTGYTSV